ncbi:Tat (twin-arginine translocation) pathway signal sequence [Filimonas lacunae]|uniref:Tat (Twin-arginine translocation) pathway signal sequence n=1 Tax=Filimonas lacunae TaxID=477680 RepID=A0A173MD49_9BACT|nr:sugar phosphate isomerase/epimerase [Filimonas lacunae]BAV05513.1 sugar phosphate isomerases/epimerases [Filimonas lacunae]SIT20634.1 Tat (twin-arginine translocation) pathway signal sequence [Filimonas lacunae]
MITRRNFLTKAGLLGAGVILAPQLAHAKTKSVAGLQLYTLREQLPKDVKGVIAKVAAAGYNEVELYGFSKANGFWGLSATELKQLLKAHGLKAPSGHYNMDQLLSTGSLEEVDAAIEASKTLGHQYVTLPYVNAKFRQTAADLQSIAAKVNTAAERIKKAGLKMAYHNHDFEFEQIGGTSLYQVLLKETDASLVDFEMDLYWVVRAGQDPISWFKKHPGRFTMVHVKDMDKADNKLNTEVGKGQVDFKSIFKEAKLAGIQHYIIEQENFKIDPYASITESCRYLKNVLLA